MSPTRKSSLSLLLLALACALPACSFLYEKKTPPPPVEWNVDSPYNDLHTIAIAPAINLSGTRDFDPLAVSDNLFAEFQQVHNINVLPVNKTLIAMQRLGVRTINDVKTAQALAEMLGADGLVVPAITAYDPYKPPTVGMILQMYTPRSAAMAVDSALPNSPSTTDAGASNQPVSQVNALFPARNQSVLHELHDYALGRAEYGSALEEERYIMDADAYMRFVCHAMIVRLMDVERTRVSDR